MHKKSVCSAAWRKITERNNNVKGDQSPYDNNANRESDRFTSTWFVHTRNSEKERKWKEWQGDFSTRAKVRKERWRWTGLNVQVPFPHKEICIGLPVCTNCQSPRILFTRWNSSLRENNNNVTLCCNIEGIRVAIFECVPYGKRKILMKNGLHWNSYGIRNWNENNFFSRPKYARYFSRSRQTIFHQIGLNFGKLIIFQKYHISKTFLFSTLRLTTDVKNQVINCRLFWTTKDCNFLNFRPNNSYRRVFIFLL